MGEKLLTNPAEVGVKGSPTEEATPVETEALSYKPKTPLGQRLWEIRSRIVASGEPLLGWEEVEQEVAERRGETE